MSDDLLRQLTYKVEAERTAATDGDAQQVYQEIREAEIASLESSLDTMFVDAYQEKEEADREAHQRNVGAIREAFRLERSVGVSAASSDLENEQRFSLRTPLTQNDRCILEAMFDLAATAVEPQTATTIVQTALSRGDQKRAFSNLKLNSLVDSKPGPSGGYWLTDNGLTIARELAASNSISATN